MLSYLFNEFQLNIENSSIAKTYSDYLIMRKTLKQFSEFLEFLEYSPTALTYKIDNSIPIKFVHNAIDLYLIWSRLKTSFPDMIITSGYRCKELNSKVGGVKGSKHLQCKALDISSMYGKEHNKQSFIRIHEFLRNNHPNVGYIYSDSKYSFIHFQIN